MTSKKRWEEVYKEENPFQLPQTLLRALKERAKQFHSKANLKYLWIYVSHDSLERPGEAGEKLSTEEWLNVLDEAASLGVTHAVISVGTSLASHPEVMEICGWAQNTYDIQVGIHFYGQSITPNDVALLSGLDRTKTTLFIDDHLADHAAELQQLGFDIFPAIGQDQEHVSPECHLPEEMTCVGASGTLYTCGLVLGEQKYRLGHCFERPIDAIMQDPALPHVIPEGTSKSKHRCNGCPPLMVQRMREKSR